MEYILGIAVSLVAQGYKKYLGTDTFGTYLAIFALSILAAALFVTLKDTEIWPSIVQVMTVAGAFHNFILRRFE
ncbi:MAG: hypothetical protein KGZ73_05235 [Rhizobiales bacterium]|nr:hypothetical protein [Hyphomicrobiales bacterium]